MCVHKWKVDSPVNGKSHAVCSLCGATSDFKAKRLDSLDKWNLHNPWHYTKDYADWRERFALACEVAGVPMSLYSSDTYIYEEALDV